MNTAIILSSGSGERFKNNIPKQFVKLAGLPLLVHTLMVFQNNSNIDEIIVVTNQEFIELVQGYVNEYAIAKVARVVCGGESRQESSFIGIGCCSEQTSYVLIHDAVRPFVSDRIINDMIKAVSVHHAVDTVIHSADTIVQVDDRQFISNIPDRAFLRRGQTPQAFEYNLIKKAHALARVVNSTDDCGLVMALGHPVFTVIGDDQNIKITFPIDLHIADKLFQLSCKIIDHETDPAGLNAFFKDKTIVVIGGTSGIGQAVSEQLTRRAKTVYALGRHTTPAMDLLDPVSVQQAIDHLFNDNKRIDCIINCAGDLIRKNVEFTAIQEWDYMYNINMRGNFLLAKAALPYLKQQKSGSFMFVGSSSYTRGRAGYSAYCSSKAALVNFCQAFAEEVSSFNIKVNLASPSRVDTPLRFKNFGKEDKKTLLTPDYVSQKIIQAMMLETTGSIFEIV